MDILSNAFVSTHFERTSHDPNGYLHAYEQGLMCAIFEKLWEHYPRHNWKVTVDAAQGYGTVALPLLMKSTLKYFFPLAKLDAEMSIVKQAGGELLERLNLYRGRADKEAIRELRAKKSVYSFRDIPGGDIAANDNRRRWTHVA